jgi:prepilin-type N-terminal cleavage/methylation domain-containing protein/prepilin-type processing-associated H-X9-DG protein
MYQNMSHDFSGKLSVKMLKAAKRTRAFTLVEMLVSVVIIALLAVLALPVVSTYRNSAQQAKCVANMRAVGAGLTVAAAENDGRYPALGYSAQSQSPTWAMAAADTMGINLGRYSQRTVFWCPSDKTAETEQGVHMQKNHVGHSSYAANLDVIDWATGESAMGGPAKGGRRIGEIGKPSSMILLVEDHHENNVISWADHGGKTCHSGWTFEYTIPGAGKDRDPGKKGFHKGRNNWLFVDGHVENLTYEETLKPINRWTIN